MKIFISPSSQEANVNTTTGYVEEVAMNKIADILIPELNRHGIETARNNKADTYAGHVIKSNAYKPDIHFAIHSNAGGGVGTEIFCFDPSNSASIGTQLAAKIYNRIAKLTPTADRGIKKGTFAEIVNTNAPSVLIEIEFHDNKAGADWIMANIPKIANEMLLAILEQAKIAYKPVVASNPKDAYVIALEGSVNTLTAQVGSLNTKILSLDKDLAESEMKVVEFANQIEGLKAKLLVTGNNLIAEVKKNADHVSYEIKLSQEITQLRTDNEKLQKQIVGLQAENATLKTMTPPPETISWFKRIFGSK